MRFLGKIRGIFPEKRHNPPFTLTAINLQPFRIGRQMSHFGNGRHMAATSRNQRIFFVVPLTVLLNILRNVERFESIDQKIREVFYAEIPFGWLISYKLLRAKGWGTRVKSAKIKLLLETWKIFQPITKWHKIAFWGKIGDFWPKMPKIYVKNQTIKNLKICFVPTSLDQLLAKFGAKWMIGVRQFFLLFSIFPIKILINASNHEIFKWPQKLNRFELRGGWAHFGIVMMSTFMWQKMGKIWDFFLAPPPPTPLTKF